MRKVLLKCVLPMMAITGLLGTASIPAFASSHREAPITALDQKADITDWYAFVSPEHPDRVVMILNVDPFLEPSNGPNYFPFDPGIQYEMKIDNDHDGVPDVIFQFRFQTEIRLPDVFTGFVGGVDNIPPITALDGPGAAGLNLRQTYTVTEIVGGHSIDLTNGQKLYAVPANVGPRTMPDYAALREEGIYELKDGVRVFAGTVADPFFIDLGAGFDSVNFRKAAGGGVLSAADDADDAHNFAPNTLAGFDCNSIAIEVPITMLTRDGKVHPASDKDAVIGTYGTTSRQAQLIRRSQTDEDGSEKPWHQIQRLGNPLINELIIGTGFKDRFSMDDPINDKQFAQFVLSPLLAQVFNSLGIPVPPAPRNDLLLLVQYQAPICPGCGSSDAGPIADLLRLNTGIPPTSIEKQKRLGFLAGDVAGFPNGRRLNDDVVDISARALTGILVDPVKFGTRTGDGVNTPTTQPDSTFPFVAAAYSGRQSVHEGPGQSGCATLPQGLCPSE
ncbi:MAG: DUF4331 domain-containing protein [Bryobacteraceae bacterium]